MVAVLGAIKVLSLFFVRHIAKILVIGFLFLLFANAIAQSWVQGDPDVFLKEFGGRIFMTDKTIEAEISHLKEVGSQDVVVNSWVYIMAMLDIYILYHIVKYTKKFYRACFGPTTPMWIYWIFAIGTIMLAEALFIRLFLETWTIPYSGFISLIENFVPLMLAPMLKLFTTWLPITPVNECINGTMNGTMNSTNCTLSFWDHLLT